MKKINARQAGILIFFNIIALKFITYPAIFSKYAGISAYIAISINLMLDLIILAILIKISKRDINKKFYEILQDCFGKTITKIIMFTIFIFFFIKSFYLLKEFHYFLVNALFSDLDFYYFIIPLLILVVYLMSKSLRALGRSSEIFFSLVLLALIVTLIIPIDYLNFSNLLPFMDGGLGSVMSACFRGSFASGDFFIFLFLMGNIKYEKYGYRKIFNYALFSSIMVIAFYVIFIAIFGNLAFGSIMAIGELPLFASFPAAVGRIDWITINLWTITALFQIGVWLNLSLFSFNYSLGLNNKKIGITIICVLVAFTIYFFFLNLADVIQLVTSSAFNKINIVYQAIICISLFIAFIVNEKKIKKEKKFAVCKKVI